MGNCASHSHLTKAQNGGKRRNFPSAKVVHVDGRLEELRRTTTAAEILSHHPNCFLCSSDTMLVGSNATQLPPDHVLQFGQIYFLMPLSKSLSPLSLQDLCFLAIKASKAVNVSSAPRLNGNRNAASRFPGGDYTDIAVTF